MSSLLLATRTGFHVCERRGRQLASRLRGLSTVKHLTTVIAREGVILAGTHRRNLALGRWRSTVAPGKRRDLPSGTSGGWHFIPTFRTANLQALNPLPSLSRTTAGDHGVSAPRLAELRDRCKWSLPYSPEAGCVRGFTFHGARGYAAVEVGWRSAL